MLSKKDYEEFATIIAKGATNTPLIEDLILYFERDNPRFDRDRFKAAINKEYNRLYNPFPVEQTMTMV